MGRRRYKEKRDPYTRDGADALELIARFSGRTSFRVPVEGRGSAPLLMASDVAAAVGMMKDRLARETAVTVVSRPGDHAIARLSLLAYRDVARAVRLQVPRPLDLRKAEDRWRLRMVLFVATRELAYPAADRPTFATLAKETKMRKATYMLVHRCATHVLEDAYNRARNNFKNLLRGDGPTEK